MSHFILLLIAVLAFSNAQDNCASIEVEKINEEYRPFCYLDPKNIPTIGIGCNMPENKALINQVTGGRYDQLIHSGQPGLKPCGPDHTSLTDAEITAIFNANYLTAKSKVPSQLSNLPSGPLSAVIDMIFAIGNINGFPSMIAALNQKDYTEAAYQMTHSSNGGPSAFCNNVGRCQRDKGCMCSAAANPSYCTDCNSKCPNYPKICCGSLYPVCCAGGCCQSSYANCCPNNKCCATGYPVCCPDGATCCPAGHTCVPGGCQGANGLVFAINNTKSVSALEP